MLVFPLKEKQALSSLVKPGEITEVKIRQYLNDPNNTNWYYGRSFASYFNSGTIQLIVFNV